MTGGTVGADVSEIRALGITRVKAAALARGSARFRGRQANRRKPSPGSPATRAHGLPGQRAGPDVAAPDRARLRTAARAGTTLPASWPGLRGRRRAGQRGRPD